MTKMVNKLTELAGEFEKLCNAERLQFYSGANTTKAAYPDSTICFVKLIFYRQMEDCDWRYIQKLPRFNSTLIMRRICWYQGKLTVFLKWLLCTKKYYEKIENPIFKLQAEYISRSLFCLSEKFTRKSLHREFSKLLQLLPKKPPIYTSKDEPDETIRRKFF